MSFQEDLSDFVPDDGPGVANAIYKSRVVKVIFDRHYLEQIGVQTSAPTALGKKADFSGVAQEDAITIGGVAYKVAHFEHDPVGYIDWTLLQLKI